MNKFSNSGGKFISFNGLNENQLDALCGVQSWGRPGAAPTTVASLVSRGLIERIGRLPFQSGVAYRCTESGAEIVRQLRAEMGE